jgi:prepilin-type processing-associated H-X9-DG protein
MSFITAIGTANPPHRISQSTIARFMEKTMDLDSYNSRKLHTIFKASGIDYRYTVLEDYGKEDSFSFFPNAPEREPFPSTQKRLQVFQEHALSVSTAAVKNLQQGASHLNLQQVTHLIVVCCTGMYAPGLDIELVQKLGLPTTVQRTSITFMGCYAAFNAIKVADAFCRADENACVLIVCTELCSLHFQKEATDDNFLANALFADGSAALLIEGKTSGTKPSLKLEAFHNDLAPEGKRDMAWSIGDLGFEMRLSTYVPDIIRKGIRTLTNLLMQKIADNGSGIRYYAIHPGGKKILEAIQQELNITEAQNKPAYDVLKNYGNMSSPTVLFVLNEIFKTIAAGDHNARILSFAFGPGLTLESMLLKIDIPHA